MKWRRFLTVSGLTLAAMGMGLILGGGMREVKTAPITSRYSSSIGPDIQQQAIRVRMRDGVELAADLYLPDGEGPFPTLVRKTPYDREGRAGDAQFFAGSGYAVLIVSQRGRFGSEGIFHQAKNEDGWSIRTATIPSSGQPSSRGLMDKSAPTVSPSDAQWQLSTAPTRPPSLGSHVCQLRRPSIASGVGLSGEFIPQQGPPGTTITTLSVVR